MTIIYSSKELRQREKNDFYPTPQEFADYTVKNLVYVFRMYDNYRYRVLDPGCGTGVWGRSIKKYLPKSVTTGIDLDISKLNNDYDNEIQRDYLEVNYSKDFDIVIGNPPYRLVDQFLDKSFEITVDGGFVIFLLRSAFTEGKRRYDKYFSKAKNPNYIYQSVSRLNFYPELRGSGDTAFSVFIWEVGNPSETILRWLDWKNK